MDAPIGAYREQGSWVQIAQVDARHLYVHIYELSGMAGDKMTEFEDVMTLENGAVRYRTVPAHDASLGCDLTLYRRGDRIVWHAPEIAPCSAYLPGGSGVLDGSIAYGSRRRFDPRRRYPGEGSGYVATVQDWRANHVPR